MSNGPTLDRSLDTYHNTLLQGRSPLLLDRSVVRRVSLAAISIVSEDFDAASRSLSHFERAFSRY